MKLPVMLKRADYLWNTFGFVVDAQTTLDDVLKPEFYVNVKEQLKTLDVLHVVSASGEFEARMRAFLTKEGVLKLRILEVHGDEAAAEPAPSVDGLTVQWAGKVHKWRIMAGTEIVSHGHSSKGEATEAMTSLAMQRAA